MGPPALRPVWCVCGVVLGRRGGDGDGCVALRRAPGSLQSPEDELRRRRHRGIYREFALNVTPPPYSPPRASPTLVRRGPAPCPARLPPQPRPSDLCAALGLDCPFSYGFGSIRRASLLLARLVWSRIERAQVPASGYFKGFERYCPHDELSLKEHRSCADGRASTRHLHGITERAARCDTVKVPAESAGAVAR